MAEFKDYNHILIQLLSLVSILYSFESIAVLVRELLNDELQFDLERYQKDFDLQIE